MRQTNKKVFFCALSIISLLHCVQAVEQKDLVSESIEQVDLRLEDATTMKEIEGIFLGPILPSEEGFLKKIISLCIFKTDKVDKYEDIFKFLMKQKKYLSPAIVRYIASDTSTDDAFELKILLTEAKEYFDPEMIEKFLCDRSIESEKKKITINFTKTIDKKTIDAVLSEDNNFIENQISFLNAKKEYYDDKFYDNYLYNKSYEQYLFGMECIYSPQHKNQFMIDNLVKHPFTLNYITTEYDPLLLEIIHSTKRLWKEKNKGQELSSDQDVYNVIFKKLVTDASGDGYSGVVKMLENYQNNQPIAPSKYLIETFFGNTYTSSLSKRPQWTLEILNKKETIGIGLVQTINSYIKDGARACALLLNKLQNEKADLITAIKNQWAAEDGVQTTNTNPIEENKEDSNEIQNDTSSKPQDFDDFNHSSIDQINQDENSEVNENKESKKQPSKTGKIDLDAID